MSFEVPSTDSTGPTVVTNYLLLIHLGKMGVVHKSGFAARASGEINEMTNEVGFGPAWFWPKVVLKVQILSAVKGSRWTSKVHKQCHFG